MFAQEKELTKESQSSHSEALEEVEDLEKEEELLIQEKEELLEVEQQLWNRINVAIQAKRQRNNKLRGEIELLRCKCKGLAEALNKINFSRP